MKSNLKKAVALLLCLFTMFTVVQTSAFALPTTTLTQAVAKPSQVKNVKATAGTNYVTMTWSKASNTTKYYVFSYNTSTKKYTCLGNTTKLTYKISNLKANTTYRFAVQAARVVSGKTYYGTVSAYVTVKTKGTSSPTIVDQVTGLKATAIGTDYITVSWNAVSGAQGYIVQWYNETTGDFDNWKTTRTSYTVRNLKPNTVHTFSVQGYNGYGCGNASDDLTVRTKSSSTVTKPAKVTNVKATASTTSVSLTWSAASGAQKYYVFTYNTSTKKYTCIGSTTSCSYKASNLKSNTTYNFAVQAAKTVNGKTYYGTVSNYVTVKTKSTVTKPAAVTGLKITTSGKSNYLKITWKAVSGASGYQVYRSTTGKSGSYSRLATLKSNQLSYANSGLSSSTPYYYAVRAYKNTSSGTLYGEFTSVNLSTRLSRDGLKKIIKNANKCYFDWCLGEALLDSLSSWDFIVDPDTGGRYFRVISDSIKSKKDIKAKLLTYFSESFCNECLYYGDYCNYIERNGKLYLAEQQADYGPGEKIRFDSVSYYDTKCIFKATTIVEDYDYRSTDTYTLSYSNGRWIYSGNNVLFSVSLFYGYNPWLN